MAWSHGSCCRLEGIIRPAYWMDRDRGRAHPHRSAARVIARIAGGVRWMADFELLKVAAALRVPV